MLKLNNVSLTYFSENGETEALKNISFEVKEGEFVAILGPSGCGKTTILSLVSGLISPTSGEIYLNGNKVSSSSFETGYMFQKDQLFEWRSILNNIYLGLEIQKRHIEKNIKQNLYNEIINKKPLVEVNRFGSKQFKKNRLTFKEWLNFRKELKKTIKNTHKQNKLYAQELLKKYGLWEFRNKYPNQLSGGMRQRVALIRTLTLKPSILLLDEPFSALDFQTRLNLCDDVARIIKNEQKTVLLVTHDITEALSLAHKIIVLTKRPGQIKNVHIANDAHDGLTPLQRRESGKFIETFDVIWKELQDHDKTI